MKDFLSRPNTDVRSPPFFPFEVAQTSLGAETQFWVKCPGISVPWFCSFITTSCQTRNWDIYDNGRGTDGTASCPDPWDVLRFPQPKMYSF